MLAFPTPPPPHLFVFGLGYVTLPLALSLRARGWTVAGLTRTPSSATRASRAGIPALHTLNNALPAANFVRAHLPAATHILSAAPPHSSTGLDPVLDRYEAHITAARPAWIAYLSSTSVYGDHAGAWVSEPSASLSSSPKGRRRRAAELRWSHVAAAAHAPLHVLRLAGVYGPGRSALTSLCRNPLLPQHTADTLDMIVSRVHLDDIIAAITAAAHAPGDPRFQPSGTSVFNVADDLPASRRQVFAYAAELLRKAGQYPSTENTDAARVQSDRNRDRTSKKVANAKMKRLLLPSLSFPTYREGLLEIARTNAF